MVLGCALLLCGVISGVVVFQAPWGSALRLIEEEVRRVLWRRKCMIRRLGLLVGSSRFGLCHLLGLRLSSALLGILIAAANCVL